MVWPLNKGKCRQKTRSLPLPYIATWLPTDINDFGINYGITIADLIGWELITDYRYQLRNSRNIFSRLVAGLPVADFSFFSELTTVRFTVTYSSGDKGWFRKRVVLANVPSFRFSFRGKMRTYPRSGFCCAGTSEYTLVPVEVPGKQARKPPFNICELPTYTDFNFWI